MSKQFKNNDIAESFLSKNEGHSIQVEKPKLRRMNMAFFGDNLEYIRTMSAVKGQSMTQYVNTLIDQDKITNENIYQRAKQLTEEI